MNNTIPLKYVLILLFLILGYSCLYSQSLHKNDSLQNELDKALAGNDSMQIVKMYYMMGKNASKSEKNTEAEIFLKNALKFSNTDNQRMKIYSKLGSIYWQKGKFDKSVLFYRNTLKISERIGNQKYQATALNNIGFIFAEYGKHEKAIEYYKKALIIRQNISYKKGIGWSYNNIAREYIDLDKQDTALNFANKSLAIFRGINHFEGESNALNTIGNIYSKKKAFKLAMKFYLESLQIREQINREFLIAESYKNIAKVYIEISNFKNAEITIKKGILLSEKIKSKKNTRNFYFLLYKLKNKKKKYKEALSAYIKYTELNDSLLSIESENKISELEIEYQTEKKEQIIKFLDTKDELNAEIILRQKNRLLFLFSGFGILLVSLIIVLSIYFKRNRAYKMLVKQSIEIVNLEKNQPDEMFEYNKSKNLPDKTKLSIEISNEKEIINDLLTIIEENRYFLNSSCTIDELAKKIKTNRQYLSKIINDKFETSFNNFINKYRIKEARKLLLDTDYDKYTIEAIAELSGFNNRTTFNIAFKKNTGVTPSFFKKEQKNLK